MLPFLAGTEARVVHCNQAPSWLTPHLNSMSSDFI